MILRVKDVEDIFWTLWIADKANLTSSISTARVVDIIEKTFQIAKQKEKKKNGRVKVSFETTWGKVSFYKPRKMTKRKSLYKLVAPMLRESVKKRTHPPNQVGRKE